MSSRLPNSTPLDFTSTAAASVTRSSWHSLENSSMHGCSRVRCVGCVCIDSVSSTHSLNNQPPPCSSRLSEPGVGQRVKYARTRYHGTSRQMRLTTSASRDQSFTSLRRT